MEFLNSGLLASAWGAALLSAVLLIAYRLGGWVLDLTGHYTLSLSRNEIRIFSSALGLIVISYGVLLLGLFKHLYRAEALLFLLICFLIGFRFKDRRAHAQSTEASRPLWEKWLWAGIISAFFLSWAQAASPPIGNDALAYHLYHPKEFILHGEIFRVPFSRESLWPYQTEMLFTLGLLLQGTMLAQFFHWLFFVLCAGAVYTFTKRFYQRRAAVIAAAAFVFCPAAFAQAGQAYVDLSFAFFTFLTIYAFCLNEAIGERRAAVLSGLFCGGALATKYLALSLAAVLALLWVIRSKERLRTFAYFVLSSALVSGIWYVRSWVVAGNPVYPFFPEIFGRGIAFDAGAGVGMGKGLLDFLKFGWNVSVHPESFGGEMIGPLFFLFLPLLLLPVEKKSSRAFYLFLFSFLYIFLLFHQSQQARFYLSLVPLLAVGVGVSVANLTGKKGFLRTIGILVFVAVLFLHAGVYVYRLRNSWPVILGLESPKDYLSRFERSFNGYLYFQKNAKPDEKIFNFADVRHFYNANPGMLHCTPAFRAWLKAENKTIPDYLNEHPFEYIWLREDSEFHLQEYALSHGYRLVHAYEQREGAGLFRYQVFRRS